MTFGLESTLLVTCPRSKNESPLGLMRSWTNSTLTKVPGLIPKGVQSSNVLFRRLRTVFLPTKRNATKRAWIRTALLRRQGSFFVPLREGAIALIPLWERESALVPGCIKQSDASSLLVDIVAREKVVPLLTTSCNPSRFNVPGRSTHQSSLQWGTW